MTRPFLTFAVPTWKRPAEVEICVRSIAGQVAAVGRQDVTIHVQDDNSPDDTGARIAAIQADYPDISIIYALRKNGDKRDYSTAFRELYSVVDAEWVWTFGDDDKLMPGALEAALTVLADTDREFIHCAERGRCSSTNLMYKGYLLDLCNTFGWLDMTGFITCNIMRGDRVKQMVASPNWNYYARSSFVQSCVLLEVLKDAPCALLDSAWVDTQNEWQTQECIDRWEKDQTGARYLMVADCIELMFSQGILTEKLKRVFWRYQNYHLWDRHISYFINDYVEFGDVRPSHQWYRTAAFTDHLEDEAFAKVIRDEVEVSSSLIKLHAYQVMGLDNFKAQLKDIRERRNESVYPWGYVIPREAVDGK